MGGGSDNLNDPHCVYTAKRLFMTHVFSFALGYKMAILRSTQLFSKTETNLVHVYDIQCTYTASTNGKV